MQAESRGLAKSYTPRPPNDISAPLQEPKTSRRSLITRNYLQIITAVEVVIDYLTVFMSFLLAKAVFIELKLSRISGVVEVRPIDSSFFLNLALVSGLVIVVFALMGLYTKKLSILNIDEMRKLFRSVLVLAILAFTISFYYKIPFSRIVLTLWLLLILLFVSIEKMVFYKIHQHLHIKGLNVKRAVIYGAGEIGRKLYKLLNQFPKLGYQVIGFLDEVPEAFAEELSRLDSNGRSAPTILGTPSDLEYVVKTYKVDDLFIARKGLSSEEILGLTNRCKELSIQFKIIPQLLGHFMENLSLQEIGGIPIITERVVTIRKMDLFLKRLMDIVFSLLVPILLLPAFVAIAILIKLDSPGPVLFTQRRVGKNGKEFTIYKFRTMHTNAAKYSHCPRDSDDPRITRVGRYLRKTSLDELPQFYNVLKGDMSIVGPRPEMPFIVAQYNPLHRKRLSVKPGITGLWQISADRTLEIHENIDYDLYYIDNYSILLDVAIIVRTVLYALLAMKTA
jgi:exopolysaccharide biosynthesis polyprenyl glycosylphosphotransferase